MTTGVLAPLPIWQVFNNAGMPNVGGSVLTQVGGVNQATYQDSGLTTPLPNPIPLNSRGEVSNASGQSCQLFLTPGVVYTFTVYDANGNQIDQASYVTQAGPPSAASIGLLLYPQTAAELAATVTPTNYQYFPGDVRRYGAVVDGATNDSPAVVQAVAQNAQGGASIYFPAGTCVCQVILTGSTSGVVIRGEGASHSVLKPISSTADVITNASGAVFFGVVIEKLAIFGLSNSYAGSGIHWVSSASPPFNVVYRDLWISTFGRSGIWDQVGCFTSQCENVLIGATGNHNFDMQGGNSTTLRNCYALGPLNITLLFTANLAAAQTSNTLTTAWLYPTGIYSMITGAGDTVAVTLTNNSTAATFTAITHASGASAVLGTAGFRVHSGTPVFLGCNGLNTGAIGALLSDNTAEDGTTSYCIPRFIGCNFESFAQVGVRNKQCLCTFESSTILAHANGVVGIQIEPYNTNSPGTLDTDAICSSTTQITLTFTGAPSGSSGGTLTGVWVYQTGTWPVTLSTGQVIYMSLTFNSTTVTWSTAVTGSPTVTATASSFKFGLAIHTAKTTGLPFTDVLSPFGFAQLSFYDDNAGQIVSMSNRQKQTATAPGVGVTNRFALTEYDLNVTGMLSSSYSGTATFAAATTVTVTFATPLPSGTTYVVLLGGNAAGYCWVTGQSNAGFTINCSVSNSNGTAWTIMVT